MEDRLVPVIIPTEQLDRVRYLYNELDATIKNKAVEIKQSEITVLVEVNSDEICNISPLEECYRISVDITGWEEYTSYSGSVMEDCFVYYVDTIDECLGEVSRIVEYAINQNKTDLTQRYINEYGNNVKAFRLNAADWLVEMQNEGNICYITSARGNSRQNCISVRLRDLYEKLGLKADSAECEYHVFYEIEIKEVKGKGRALIRLAFHQTEDMPLVLRKLYKRIMQPIIGKEYEENKEWYSYLLESINLNGDVSGNDIYDLLDHGLEKGEKVFERIINEI